MRVAAEHLELPTQAAPVGTPGAPSLTATGPVAARTIEVAPRPSSSSMRQGPIRSTAPA